MTNSVVDIFIYENLKPIAQFNDETKLCIYEPSHKLFVLKNSDISSKSTYEALLSLKNPHLAKILCVVDKTDHIDVVREYISGDTLADILKRQKTLDTDLTVKITADICDGLSDIHKLGFVHRDITPNNIIITSDGCAKIIDFGIARCFSENKNSDTTILGTPGYAAPEQFGFTQSDAKTDIYAVGVLLNVMLTGDLPNVQKAKGPLGKIVRKCIEIDSRHRYKDIDDLKNAVFNKVIGSGPLDRIIKHIPGIRSRNIFVVLISIIGYFFSVIFSIAVFSTVKNNLYFQTAVAWLLFFPVPYFCFTNFLNIWDRLPFSRGATKRNQRIVYIFLGIVSILSGLIIIGTMSSI